MESSNLVPRAFPSKNGWGGKSPGDEVGRVGHNMCKANGKPGSALAMEPEGVDRIVRQSVALYQTIPYAFSARSILDSTVSCDVTKRDSPTLSQTSRRQWGKRVRLRAWSGTVTCRIQSIYCGEGDSKSLSRVEGVSVQKKECTGHAQKRVGFSTS